jgi:hypothetical protein
MTGSSYFGRRFIGDGSKGRQVRLTANRPTGPQTCDGHVFCRIRPEFENDVFVFLAYCKIAAFHSGAGHILIERIDDDKAMRVPEKVSPEALQIIAPCVAGGRVLHVVCGQLAGNATLVTHRLYDALSIFHYEYRRTVTREDARVSRLRLRPLDIVELAARPCDFIGGNSLNLGRRFRHSPLQGAFSIVKPLTLLEEVLLRISLVEEFDARRVSLAGIGNTRPCPCLQMYSLGGPSGPATADRVLVLHISRYRYSSAAAGHRPPGAHVRQAKCLC